MIRTLALLLLLVTTAATAQEPQALDGVLEVRSAYVINDNGVFQLNARIEYPMNEQIQQALKNGVTLSFDLQIVVTRHRRLWLDAGVLDVTRRRELVYHAVSERYVVRDVDDAQQDTYPTLAAALERIGTVEALPVLTGSQVPPGDYEIAVRAGVRRGRMPDPLRALIFWSDSWHRTSDWYAWSLPR